MNRKRKLSLTRARVSKHRAMNTLHGESPDSFQSNHSDCEHSDTNNVMTALVITAPENVADFIVVSKPLEEESPTSNFEVDHEIRENETPDRAENDPLQVSAVSDSEEGNEQYLSMESDPNDTDVGETSTSTLENNAEVENESDELRKWAIECNISQAHLDKLLSILSKRLLPDLPKSSKTFLQTSSATYDIEKMENQYGQMSSEFVYFGIEVGLRACVDEAVHSSDTIHLQINIDGLPLFKSSAQEMWPILCKVHFDPNIYHPFPIAVYVGIGKPKSLHLYLDKFISEMNKLSREGLLIGNKLFQIRIQCFVCDTPARSFLKCTKGHGGYYACERCTTRGERGNGRTIYPSADSPRRTDASFRSHEQPEHHNGNTPLTLLSPPVDMVSICVLDSMHLLCGIMKKLLVDHWLGGDRRNKLDRRSKLELSRRMDSVRSQVPCEFQRKPGSIAFVAKWKATQFRFFLLYCGPIVLKNVLNQKLYKHFLLLHVAARILSTRELAVEYNEVANSYLKLFFAKLCRYYGLDSQIMNMHNLLHISDDAKNMNCSLSEITSFPFENMLGKMKKILRTPNRPLAQLCRRLHEAGMSGAKKQRACIPPKVEVLRQGNSADGVNIGYNSIQKVRYNDSVLSVKAPNDIVLLDSGKILKIEQIRALEESVVKITLIGKLWKISKPVFTFPCDSKDLKMWELESTQSQISQSCSINSVQRKMVQLAVGRSLEGRIRVYAIPLLHCN